MTTRRMAAVLTAIVCAATAPDSAAAAPVISGHRDWLATECPGERLYARLPELREQVATLVGLGRP
jgi:hypothetical protein